MKNADSLNEKSITHIETREAGGLGKIRRLIGFSFLICFMSVSCGEPAGDGSSVDGINPGEHRIFVTSVASNGAFGGLDGADAFCQSLAVAAGLKKTYKAIMSSSLEKAKDRLNLLGPIYIFNGAGKETVAEIGIDLWSSNLLSPIVYDENENPKGATRVWTGTDSNGSNFGSYCSNWTSSSSGALGSVGDNIQTNGYWVEDPNEVACDTELPLYCVSQ